jgi:carbon monoxide dehydrogenase subunit G
MRMTGEHVLHASPERVWDALLDPEVLVRTIPGCDRLVGAGEHAYDMTVTAGVSAVRGTYDGSCRLTDLDPHSSLVMHLEGAGSPGTIGAEVRVGFEEAAEGTTLTYDADAVVGGMVGGVGQRMLTSVARRMAGEFFSNVDAVLTGAAVGETAAAVAAPAAPGGGPPGEVAGADRSGQVFTAPVRASTGLVASPEDFLKGIAVGAGLVVLGVLLGRRR